MSPDYEVDRTVRRMRWLGRGCTVVIALGIVLALGWKMAQVSEQRALDATRENLAASLNSLATEQMAKNQVLDEAWRKRNPFVLLRWQQDNYCGELAAGAEPQTGCWYWLPAQAWVLYRPRFADEWTKEWGEMRVYRLLTVPGSMPTGAQLIGAGFTLELQAVSQAEQSAAGLLSH